VTFTSAAHAEFAASRAVELQQRLSALASSAAIARRRAAGKGSPSGGGGGAGSGGNAAQSIPPVVGKSVWGRSPDAIKEAPGARGVSSAPPSAAMSMAQQQQQQRQEQSAAAADAARSLGGPGGLLNLRAQGVPRHGGTPTVLSALELERLKARRTNRWPQKRNFVPSRHLWIGCL
jgi:hypothetical protein